MKSSALHGCVLCGAEALGAIPLPMEVMMSTLMQANRQWATRPYDQRFTSLTELAAHVRTMRANSRQAVVPAHRIGFAPTPDNAGLLINVPQADMAVPTHWSFGQMARLAGAGMPRMSLIHTQSAPLGLRQGPADDATFSPTLIRRSS